MAKTFTAPFAQTYKTNAAAVTAALTGIGTSAVTGAVLLATAGTNGALVTKVTAIPRATVTAASLVLFLVKASAPAVYNLIDSELMAAYTLAATTAIPETAFGNIAPTTPLRLEAGDMLYVGSQVALAAGIVFYAEQADL
ncbi:hypothetical protein [Pseudomonas sp. DP16D-R1]|uniref:hypothetical protein n=1 Tax=Pseudomonas sp. DP16D-R1 TaxID=2075551 RepID=UPI000CD1392C|nr:hypothetical protein [Pseudomonas sp. DP16D-R1]POA77338.1 hypothetical protein C1890_15985 [Pseudomonas sp. DP16D-R1]